MPVISKYILMSRVPKASTLDRGLECRNLLANPGYDLDRNVTQVETPQMAVVIPPKKNRTQLRTYDRELYRLRHRLENPFL